MRPRTRLPSVRPRPAYTRFPGSLGVAARIGEVLPRARLIYVVRHPIERMISQYKFNVSMHWEKRPLDALEGNSLYLDGSRYATQVEQYLEYFLSIACSSSSLRT
jgi:hypothetical protein